MKRRNLLSAVILVVMAYVASACSGQPGEAGAPTPLPVVSYLGGVKAEGRLEPIRYVELSPVITGVVSEVLVSEGDEVAAGELIATIDGPGAQGLETARDQAAVELGAAHQDLRAATEDLDAFRVPRVFAGLTAEQAARTWLTELDAARDAFAPYKGGSRKALKPREALNEGVYPSMPPRVLVDTGEYDEVAAVHKKRVDLAWSNYTKAIGWLHLAADVAAAQARVDEAQRRFTSLQEEASATAGTRAALASAEIRAPFAGTVTRQAMKVGEVANGGIPVVTVADLSGWVIRTTDLTEIDVSSLQVGAAATIRMDAAPDDDLSGRVLAIGLDYVDREGDILYPVELLLGDTRPWLRWGMTADVTFGE